MAINWGSMSGHQQVGIDVSFSPSTITKDTSSVTVTWKIYTRWESGWETTGDNQVLHLTNAISENIAFYNEGPVGAKLRATRTQSVSTSYSGTVSRTLKAQISDQWNGGTPNRTQSVTIPKRPPQAPSAPTSATLTRVSDTQHNVSWVRPANAGNDSNIWTWTDIYRYSETLGTYALMVSLTGSPTSWSDTSTKVNNRYRYRVEGRNVSGSSAFAQTSSRSTTPAAPTNVQAARVGSDIVVTWNESHIVGDELLEVRDGSTILGTVAQNTGSTFTHTSPNPAVTHQYTVRAVTPASESPVLYSAWSSPSNVVQLQAPPNPPTNLSPNGVTVARTTFASVVLSWTHNPVDTSAQTKYQYQHREAGSAIWSTSPEHASSTSSASHAFGSYAEGAEIEWRVRTWGDHATGSGYSATASFVLSTAPTVSIDGPVGTVTTPSATIDWTYFQAGSSPQNSWAVELYDQAAPAIRIYQASGNGSAATHTTTPLLENGHSYNVRVRVRSALGLWSAWYQAGFDVAFPQPLPPVVEVECLSTGAVAIRASAQSDGVAPETDSLRIVRSINGGPWVLLAEDLGLDIEFLDWTGLTYGDNIYRVIAVTAAGAVDHTEVVAQCRNDCDIFLSGGPGFAVNVQLRYGTERTLTVGRERVLNQYSERSLLVETSGVHVARRIAITAHTMPPHLCRGGNSQPDALEALFELPGPHLYRDGTGRRMYCSLSDLTVGQGFMAAVGFTVTEADAGTVAQQEAVMGEVGPVLVEVSPGEYAIYGGGVQAEVAPGEWTWEP